MSKKKGYIPVWTLGEPGVPSVKVVVSEITDATVVDATTGKVLDDVPKWGDLRPDGKPYHGGIYHDGMICCHTPAKKRRSKGFFY